MNKIYQVIADYAHDYRDIAMNEQELMRILLACMRAVKSAELEIIGDAMANQAPF